MIGRLKEIIAYKTDGNKAQFAEMLGWSPQYLNRIISGAGSFGIRPLKAVLSAMPEINARWLLFGTGQMLDRMPSDSAMHRLLRLIELERYMPVMSGDELRMLEAGKVDWDADSISRWERLLSEPSRAEAEVMKARKRQKGI